MSRLVFEGELNKNFGEYYPTPYIDKVEVRNFTDDRGHAGYNLTVDFSLLFAVPEDNDQIPWAPVELVAGVLDKINIFLMFTKSKHNMIVEGASEHPESLPGLRFRKLHERLKLYESVTGIDYTKAEDPLDELSLLLYDSSILPIFFTNPPIENTIQDLDKISDMDRMGAGLGYDLIEVDPQDILTALLKGEIVSMHNRSGRKFLKVKTTIEHNMSIYLRNPLTNEIIRPEDCNINLLAFSGMMSEKELVASGISTNAGLSLLFGDVAYENILDQGNISSQLEESYFDDNNEVFVDPPIQTLQGTYHKPDTITHQTIYDKFTALLNKYVSIIPGGPEDAENMDPQLMSSVEVMQYALMTYKNNPNLIQKINDSRKQIINRSSGTRTGALFADSAELLGRANDIAGRGTPLTKKLTINAKVVDFRSDQLGAYEIPSPDPVDPENLFNIKWGRTIAWTNRNSTTFNLLDWVPRGSFGGMPSNELTDAVYAEGEARSQTSGEFMGGVTTTYNEDGTITMSYRDPVTGERKEVKMTHLPSGIFEDQYIAKQEYNITNGFAFFDISLAARKDSFLSQIVDFNKFTETFGWGLISKYFVPKKYTLRKNAAYIDSISFMSPFMDDIPEDSAESPSRRALVFSKEMTTSHLDAGAPPEYWPGTVDPVEANNGHVLRMNDYSIIKAPEEIDLGGGELLQHYVAERNWSFLPYPDETRPNFIERNNKYGNANTYKIMVFEFQNIDSMALYMNYNDRIRDQYNFEMDVIDYTKASLVHVIKHYWWLHYALLKYLNDASLECSYNNVDGVFNDFFSEQMVAAFSANPAGAPWIFIPVVYVRHVDFLTNKYNGDRTQMMLAAREIIQKISPQTGTLDQLRAFYQNYIDLYTDYYSQSSVIGQRLQDFSVDPTATGAYSEYFGITRNYVSKWFENSSYTYQSETNRDQFLTNVSMARDTYQTVSDAYKQALNNVKRASKQTIKRAFADRYARYIEKIDYELDRISGDSNHGCYYAMWWDGWTQRVTMRDRIGSMPDEDGRGQSITRPDEFDEVYPDGGGINCRGKYGYYWIAPWKKDEAEERYPVEKYGEPTSFANYFRDHEKDGQHAYCRCIKKGYRFSRLGQRQKSRGDNYGGETYQGTAIGGSGDGPGYGLDIAKFGMVYPNGGDPVAKGDIIFIHGGGAEGSTASASQRTEQLSRMKHDPLVEDSHTQYYNSNPVTNEPAMITGFDWYYMSRLPEFDYISKYKFYHEWLADATSGVDTYMDSDAALARTGEGRGGITDAGTAIIEGTTARMWKDIETSGR